MSTQPVSARLSARVESLNVVYLRKSGGDGPYANDSYVQGSGRLRRSRISAEMARRIVDRLTDHDRQVIEVLNTVHLATGAQLHRLLWGDGRSDARQGRRQLAKLSELRVVARLGRTIGGVRAGSSGYTYRLDVIGQYLVEGTQRRRRPRTPGSAFVAHAVAVTECYVRLRQLEMAASIELVHFRAEPTCWRNFTGPGGGRITLKPDAYAVIHIGEYEDRWFIEVDRATEHPGRLKRKAELYVRYWHSGREQITESVFPKVLWVVPDDGRKSQLIDALWALSAEHWHLFQVCTDATFAATISAGAGADEGGEDEKTKGGIDE